LAIAFVASSLGACHPTAVSVEVEALPPPAEEFSEPIWPIPLAKPEIDPKLAALGERLFSDKRLSSDASVSCASCHSLAHGGADGKALSTGAGGKHPVWNTPSIYDLAYEPYFGWLGTAKSIEDQVDLEFAAPDRMGNAPTIVAERLGADPELAAAFRETFPSGGLDATNVSCALADYLRTLVEPESTFDKFMRGDKKALPDGASLGFVEFKSFGCASCHQGIGAGGNILAKMSLDDAMVYVGGGDDREGDPGRFAVTGEIDDLHVVRVPSLRNVACTAPYLHDGSAATLKEAVRREAINQVGPSLNDYQIASISVFLGTFDGACKARTP
jgi:cytochrome c peroxidase